ncbi:hypothetical protein CJ030_MR7G017873 [Morella rubra]|uniref:Uncharacterized protein n=1 Tax=Morella rubra TaxID=262757 RepID=A0A6A1UZD1_9ROSI|nr:hypothetical protein CJ030_MR7G017873 [Morella rubra]
MEFCSVGMDPHSCWPLPPGNAPTDLTPKRQPTFSSVSGPHSAPTMSADLLSTHQNLQLFGLPCRHSSPITFLGTRGMAQVSNSKALTLVFVAVIFWTAAATAFELDSSTAPSPAPSMDTGAGFFTPVSGAAVGFSIAFSLIALFKQ